MKLILNNFKKEPLTAASKFQTYGSTGINSNDTFI